MEGPDPGCVPPGDIGDGSSTHSVLDVSDGGGFASFDALLAAANAGGLFVDMHTEANPDGEIRGQLVPAQPTLHFTAHLDSAQVYSDATRPGSDSTATGTSRVEIDPVLLTMTTDLEWSGLTGSSRPGAQSQRRQGSTHRQCLLP